MKANSRLAVWVLTLVAMSFSIACSSNSGSSGSATAASVLAVTPNPAVVAANGQLPITPTGGTPPYIFSLQSSIGGSLTLQSGTTTTFIAGPSGGMTYLTITDSANQVIQLSITVTGLTVSPLNTTVAPGGTVSYIVSGGSGNYTYNTTGSYGTFVGAVFTVAPATAVGTVITVQITDATSNQSVTATIDVSGTAVSSTAGSCEGNFALNLDGYPGTLQITEDASGNISGALAVTGYGYPAPIYGTCVSGTINFTDEYSGSAYTATYILNPNTNTTVFIGGTFTGGGIWSAM